jgi:3-hydroxyisobutyrate dehydrogenase
MHTIAVIGLGNMGLGMATTLAGKGFAVAGLDLSPERCEIATAHGINVSPSLAALAASASMGSEQELLEIIR